MGLLSDLFRKTGREGLWKGRSALLPPLWMALALCLYLQQGHCAISVTVPTNLHTRSKASPQSLCLPTLTGPRLPQDLQTRVFLTRLVPNSPTEYKCTQTYRARVSVAAAEGAWVLETSHRGDVPSAAHSSCM